MLGSLLKWSQPWRNHYGFPATSGPSAVEPELPEKCPPDQCIVPFYPSALKQNDLFVYRWRCSRCQQEYQPVFRAVPRA